MVLTPITRCAYIGGGAIQISPHPPSINHRHQMLLELAIEHYNLNDEELSNISGLLDISHSITPKSDDFIKIETLSILLEFYSAQDQTTYPYLASITAVRLEITLSL